MPGFTYCPAEGAYLIQNRNSGKCLDVYHSSTADYANVDQYDCNGTGAELWEIGITNGHRYFANFTSQKRLEVYHSEMADNANVDQYHVNTSPTEQWYGDIIPGDSARSGMS